MPSIRNPSWILKTCTFRVSTVPHARGAFTRYIDNVGLRSFVHLRQVCRHSQQPFETSSAGPKAAPPLIVTNYSSVSRNVGSAVKLTSRLDSHLSLTPSLRPGHDSSRQEQVNDSRCNIRIKNHHPHRRSGGNVAGVVHVENGDRRKRGLGRVQENDC